MQSKFVFFLVTLFFIFSCSNPDKELVYQPTNKLNPFNLYKEGLDAFEINDYFFASKKFSEAELNFDKVELAAKSSIMSSYSLYGIGFYEEALENLERYLKTYPADKNIIYAHYLIAIIYFEQIEDEKKDLKPLIDANNKIDFLNIDVEGNELKVLKSLNFKRYTPKLICIEIHNFKKIENENFYKSTLIYEFLMKKNYELFWRKGFSFIFKTKS